MKQDAEQESSLLYWEIQDDTTRKHQSLKQTLFFLVCFLMAGFGLYQMVKETPVAGVGSMNELEVGSAPPHYELESAVGATAEVDVVEEEGKRTSDCDGKYGVEGKFFFHNEYFDAEDLCEGYNCGPEEGSCLLLPTKGDGEPSCIVDQKYLTEDACDNDKGVWCENIYRDEDVVDGEDDFEDEEDEVVEGVNPLEMSIAVKEKQFKLVQDVQVPVGGYIGGKDWCDCGKKGDLKICGDVNRYWSGNVYLDCHYVKPNNQQVEIHLSKKVYRIYYKCTGGGPWRYKNFSNAHGKRKMVKVRFNHQRKHCPSKWRKKRSGRIFWG